MEPQPWMQFVDAASEHGSAREIIVALARHIASETNAPSPAIFAADPGSSEALRAQCSKFAPAAPAPDLLGHVWEVLLTTDERRKQGAHFTPRSVTDRLVELTLDALIADDPQQRTQVTIWDPACGGGAFLLAACRALEQRLGWTREAIVAGVFASDIDKTALDITVAALQLWARTDTAPRTHCGDVLLTLPADWPVNIDLIVGNPPFLGQLTTDTSRDEARRRALALQFDGISGTYVDEAGLFLELCLRRGAVNGSVGLILPESILGTRDAESVRASARARSALHTLWVDEGQSFAAAVDVVGLVFTAHDEELSGKDRATAVVRGVGDRAKRVGVSPEPAPQSWAPLLAFAQGVPLVNLDNPATVGSLAQVTAGFRQHFYGLQGAVKNGLPTASTPALVTSGAIEPLDSGWGSRAVKFAGQVWASPVVCIAEIGDPAVREWFAARQIPKLLLASQTRVLEAIVDPDALTVPSVPVVSVEPIDPGDLWKVAAVMTSPAVTAWMLQRAAGTGLSHDAIRVRAATLAEIPLPPGADLWKRGAEHAQVVHNAAVSEDVAAYVSSLRDLAKVMDAAYGVGGEVGAWWWERLRLPEGFSNTSY